MFNANVQPKDCDGNAITPGRWRVERRGKSYCGTVFESPDDFTTLLVRFDGEERVQRVDELSQFCVWIPDLESPTSD